jgi:hypothetical protein
MPGLIHVHLRKAIFVNTRKNSPEIQPFKPYLQLLLHAIKKLPRLPQPVPILYRGEKKDGTRDYRKTDFYPLEHFVRTSKTRDLAIEGFAKTHGTNLFGTILEFHDVDEAVDISLLSTLRPEDEILILQSINYKVESISEMDNGLKKVVVVGQYGV